MKLHIVPARTGIDWVKSGIRVFGAICHGVPVFYDHGGHVDCHAGSADWVGAGAGIVACGHAGDDWWRRPRPFKGVFPTPAVMLKALRTGRERLRDMAVLGALYAAGFFAVMGFSALFDGGMFAQVYMGGEPMTREIAGKTRALQTAMWVSMVLYLPLSLLFWHAPGLVHWHGVPPVKSLFFSIIACDATWVLSLSTVWAGWGCL